jgi:hypothetical protein
MIRPGDEIIAGDNQRFRVLDVVTFEAEAESPFVARSNRAAVGPGEP